MPTFEILCVTMHQKADIFRHRNVSRRRALPQQNPVRLLGERDGCINAAVHETQAGTGDQ